MKLDFNNVQKMSELSIFNLLNNIIDTIYCNYVFKSISKDEYYEIVSEEIIKSKNIGSYDLPYKKYMEKAIKLSVCEYIKKLLSENNSSLKVINNYIINNICYTDDYTLSIKEINKLALFFDTYEFAPNPDLLIDIIKGNSILYNMLANIYNKNKITIQNGQVEDVIKNSDLIAYIEIYCMINEIDITSSNKKNVVYDDIPDNYIIYIRDILKNDLLSPEEEKMLAARAQEGDKEALNLLVESNLRLVVSVAKRYVSKGLSIMDLIQDGSIGLMTAARKFDYTKGYKFSTYATQWIRQGITRGLADRGRLIRLPVHAYEGILSYKRMVDNLQMKLNRIPTEEEIASATNLSIDKIRDYEKNIQEPLSLNQMFGEDEDITLEECIKDDENLVEEEAISTEMKMQIHKLLDNVNMSDRSKGILKLRYGLEGQRPLTLEEIGNIYDLTRERVRQIILRALKQIVLSKEVDTLVDYVDHGEEILTNLRRSYSRKKTVNTSIIDDSPKKNNNSKKQFFSIYDYFNEYPSEQIQKAVLRLDEEDLKIIKLRFGEDLEGPYCVRLTREERYKLYSSAIPKLRVLLENSNHKVRKKTK